MIARCTPWGTIILGKDFYRLTPTEQDAVLAHERGHIAHRHAWKRIWWFVTLRAFFKTQEFFDECRKHEKEADRYAVERGHRAGLVSVLFRLQLHVKSPELEDRLENLHVR